MDCSRAFEIPRRFTCRYVRPTIKQSKKSSFFCQDDHLATGLSRTTVVLVTCSCFVFQASLFSYFSGPIALLLEASSIPPQEVYYGSTHGDYSNTTTSSRRKSWQSRKWALNEGVHHHLQKSGQMLVASRTRRFVSGYASVHQGLIDIVKPLSGPLLREVAPKVGVQCDLNYVFIKERIHP